MANDPTTTAATGHMPEVLCNEDNQFFIVIALALHLRDCEGLSAEDAYVWTNDVRIESRSPRAQPLEVGSTMTDSPPAAAQELPHRPRVLVPGPCAYCGHLYDGHDWSVGEGTKDVGCPECEGGMCRAR